MLAPTSRDRLPCHPLARLHADAQQQAYPQPKLRKAWALFAIALGFVSGDPYEGVAVVLGTLAVEEAQ
jgi:hypothetical protein